MSMSARQVGARARSEARAADMLKQMDTKAKGKDGWDYRVMRHHAPAYEVGCGRDRVRVKAETCFGIHEVYYDESGKLCSWTDPIDLVAETVGELRGDLDHMLKAFAQPVLDLATLQASVKAEAKVRKLDMDKIAKGLGAERRGKVRAGSGYFRALQTVAEVQAVAATSKNTLFDRFLAEQMKSPTFAAEYERAGFEIRATDNFVRGLVIEFSRETDGRWIAEVPKPPGVMAYGSTRAEALSNVQILAAKVFRERLPNAETRAAMRELPARRPSLR